MKSLSQLPIPLVKSFSPLTSLLVSHLHCPDKFFFTTTYSLKVFFLYPCVKTFIQPICSLYKVFPSTPCSVCDVPSDIREENVHTLPPSGNRFSLFVLLWGYFHFRHCCKHVTCLRKYSRDEGESLLKLNGADCVNFPLLFVMYFSLGSVTRLTTLAAR